MTYEYLLDKLLDANPGDTIEDEDGKTYEVKRDKDGCRFVRIRNDTVLREQDIHKKSKFAEMARQGARIGWIIPWKRKWTLVRVREK